MFELLDRAASLLRPLTNPLLVLAVMLVLEHLRHRRRSSTAGSAMLLSTVAVCFAAHLLVCRIPAISKLLLAVESPLFAVMLTVVLPAVYLPRGRAYRLFLAWPAAILAVAVASVFHNYHRVPDGEWAWFLIRPAWLAGGVAALLVLLQPLLSLKHFRFAVRLSCLLVLLYGGLAFRKNYRDYRDMVQRRPAARPGLMNLSETSPVLQHESRKVYLPSAPCRFTSDGGYVQGCNMELFQRVLQVDLQKARKGDAAALGEMRTLAGALLAFLVMSFIMARWFCGWLCPLSTLGDVLDWVRRKLRLPHFKPAAPVKLGYLFSGAGLAAVTLAMAKAYPAVDENQKFMGCKIPLFPFCKICPSQQVCPVVAGGVDNYPGLPAWSEWPFFRTFVLVLLVLFAVSFAVGRRLWCRFCPMGMISGCFNRGGMITLRKDPAKCNRCGVCAEVCPMDIDLVRSEMNNTDVTCYDCVLCLKCLEKCPRDGCLSLEHAGKTVTESRFEGGH